MSTSPSPTTRLIDAAETAYADAVASLATSRQYLATARASVRHHQDLVRLVDEVRESEAATPQQTQHLTKVLRSLGHTLEYRSSRNLLEAINIWRDSPCPYEQHLVRLMPSLTLDQIRALTPPAATELLRCSGYTGTMPTLAS